MIINIPDFAIGHFWEEPPKDSMEFWALRFKPKAQKGDTIYFKYQGKVVATAIIYSIQYPGISSCETTGKYQNRWKVFWTQESFKDMR